MPYECAPVKAVDRTIQFNKGSEPSQAKFFNVLGGSYEFIVDADPKSEFHSSEFSSLNSACAYYTVEFDFTTNAYTYSMPKLEIDGKFIGTTVPRW